MDGHCNASVIIFYYPPKNQYFLNYIHRGTGNCNGPVTFHLMHTLKFSPDLQIWQLFPWSEL